MSVSVHVVCPRCDAVNRVLKERLNAARCGKCKAPLAVTHPVELSGSNFDHHLKSNDLPVIVDFWAPWCGPCRMMAPAYEQAAVQLGGEARLAKLNSEEEPEIAARYSIRSIPTLIAFRNGREIARQSGAMDLRGLLAWIRSSAVEKV